MHLLHKWLGCSLLITRCFVSATASQTPLREELTDDADVRRIAIIGAGAAGSSTAYHLAQFHQQSDSNVKLDITIYEQGHMIGGRTTTVHALDDVRYPTEVGASIFVKINHILYNATRDFDLDTKVSSPWNTGSLFNLGVWDGKDMVFTLANDDGNGGVFKGRFRGWWDIAKLFWKYGLSPLKTKRLSKTAVNRFLNLYDDYFPWQDLTQAVATLDLQEFTSVSGQTLLRQAGIGEKFSRDLIQASTRVNYGQNLGGIHGLETMVCMAIEGAMAIDGGNWQIFDEMVKRSGANVRFNTAVSSVARTDSDTYFVSTNTSHSNEHHEYDTIVLAAPYQFANVTFHPALSLPPEKIDYVTLHVTLFTSPHRPSPSYFGLDSQEQVPDSILTTLSPGNHQEETHRGKDGVGSTKFWSLSTLRVLEPTLDEYPEYSSSSEANNRPTDSDGSQTESHSKITDRQHLYKIFSPSPVTATLLSQIFDLDHPSHPSPSSSFPTAGPNKITDEHDPISLLSPNDITWSHTRTWQSYPYLPPRTTFDPITLDSDSALSTTDTKTDNDTDTDTDGDEKTKTGGGRIYYTSGIESLISTMETSALSGMNVARLVVDRLPS